MNKIKSAALLAGGLLMALSVNTAAHADTSTATRIIHPGGFNQELRDVRSAGHEGFLSDGLAIWTDDNSGQAKVAEYWNVSPQNLPAAVTLDWSGTSPQPGTQIVFDFDQTTGNGNDFNILVGEPVYNDPDGTPTYWLTNSSSGDAHAVCPRTTGGSGTACWGTLAEWRTAMQNVRVDAYGFSLGSGIKGAGIIHSLAVDDVNYRFSDNADTLIPTDTTGASSTQTTLGPKAKTVKVTFKTDKLLANQSQGKRLAVKVVSDGVNIFSMKMTAGQVAHAAAKYKLHTGKHVTAVYVGGVQVQFIQTSTGH